MILNCTGLAQPEARYIVDSVVKNDKHGLTLVGSVSDVLH